MPVFLLFATGLLVIGCRQQREEVPPEFRKLKPAPANPPLRVNPIPDSRKDSISVLPPAGGGPLVRILRAGKILQGEYNFTGKIVASRANVFRFLPNQGPEIMIGFALPEVFPLKSVNDVEGSLYLKDASSPAGADQTVTIRTERLLVAGYIWKTSVKPISYNPRGDVVIAQRPLSQLPTGNTLLTVEVLVNTNEGNKTVPLGKNFAFTLGEKNYMVFVDTSLFQSTATEGDDTTTAYILRALIVEN